jgi:hypothetical protein
VEEGAQGEVQPRVRLRERAHGVVPELRPADASVYALEQPDEVHAVGARHGRVVVGAGGPWLRDGQVRVDAGDVQDRLGLQVENRGILAQVRDLDHAPTSGTVVDQERLIALAAEIDRGSLDTEDASSDLGDLLGDEPRRRCLEHAHGASP